MNIVYKTINLTIQPNQNFAEVKTSLPYGKCIGMTIITTTTPEPNEIVNLTILDGGNEIVEGSDFRLSKKTTAGKWIDSLRPMSFNCNRNITTRLSSENPLPGGLKTQVLYYIIQQ
ncbi:hypothetical protein [Maribacter sp.]|uniref:hypothetical protein n=1 Tax=Maribacter sp. TaxID=1897614 RepID=UPI0025C615D8|nr:hypothetical protein [Maribacter sp.]